MSRTRVKLTTEQAARLVIAALKKADHTEEETHDVFAGLFFGKQWESYELFCAIREAFKEEN